MPPISSSSPSSIQTIIPPKPRQQSHSSFTDSTATGGLTKSPIISTSFAGYSDLVIPFSSTLPPAQIDAQSTELVSEGGREQKNRAEEQDLQDPSLGYAIRILGWSIAPAAAGFLLEGVLSLSCVVVAGRLGPLALAIAGRGQAIQMFTGNIITTASCCAQITLSAPLFTAVRGNSGSRDGKQTRGRKGGVENGEEGVGRVEEESGTADHVDEQDETNGTPPTEQTPILSTHPPISLKSGMGTIAQRAFLLNMILEIPVIYLWWNIEGVFRWLGQPEVLCVGLREYMRWAMVGIPGYAFLEISKSYLQSQSIFHVPPILAAIWLPFHLLLTHHLVHRTSLGVYGAPIAMFIAEYVIAFGVTAYILLNRSGSLECWGGWSRKAFNGWWDYLQIMIPAMFMYGAGAWCFEIVSLMAGRLGETAVAAQAAVASLDLFLIMIPCSAALASLARLGNIIGRSQAGVRSAIISVRAIYIIMISLACLTAAAMIIFREALARLFTDDKPTADLIEKVLVPMALYQVWDYMDCCGGSILRATAKQHLAATINMFAFYVIALPLAYYLGIHLDKGLPAMWAALNIGLFSVALFTLLFYIFAIDWPKEMAKAERRREAGQE